VLIAVPTAATGVILLGAGCAGYLFRPLGWVQRAALWLASIMLLLPSTSGLLLFADFAGVVLAAIIIAWEWSRRTPSAQRVEESNPITS